MSFIFIYLKEILIGLLGLVLFFFSKSNRNKKIENEKLKRDINQVKRTVEIQNKVLNASQKVNNADLDTNLDRLSAKDK